MFGLNKKNQKSDQTKSVTMEMETMESDLAGEKPERESVSLRSNLIKKEGDQKKLSSKEEPKIAKRPPSPFAEKPTKSNTALSGKFLPEFEKMGGNEDESILLPKEQKKSPFMEKKDERLESVVLERPHSTKIRPPFQREKEVSQTPRKEPEKKLPKKSDFGSLLNKKPENSLPKYTKNTNWGLILTAFAIFAIAIASGAYYYFFVLKQAPDKESAIQIETETELDEPVEIIQTEEIGEVLEILPLTLEEADPLEIKEQNLLKTLATIPQEEINLEEGRFYQIMSGYDVLDANSILSNLGIILPDEVASSLEKGWIFARKLNGHNLRLGMILSIKDSSSASNIKTTLINNEKILPDILDSLYIEDQIPLLEEQSIVFSDSMVDSSFRYYNFYPDKTYPSVDWGVKTYETEDGSANLLIFSTSMEITQVISSGLSE